MATTQRTPSLVKVIHGANEGVFGVAGHTVGVVRASLEVAFNIPPDAAPFVNGVGVGVSYVLIPNDTLEFVYQDGQKGLGDLLTPEDLMARWKLTAEQYHELQERGLPTITFADGTARHPEVAVDEWWKAMGGHMPLCVPTPAETHEWQNTAGTLPPLTHQFGPLEGTQKELASWLHPQGNDDPRHLRSRAKASGVWIRRIHARHYEAWFRSQQAFEAALQRRHKGSRVPPETA